MPQLLIERAPRNPQAIVTLKLGPLQDARDIRSFFPTSPCQRSPQKPRSKETHHICAERANRARAKHGPPTKRCSNASHRATSPQMDQALSWIAASSQKRALKSRNSKQRCGFLEPTTNIANLHRPARALGKCRAADHFSDFFSFDFFLSFDS